MEIDDLIYLDGKAFCKEVMKRPAMYVGEPRLDYIQHFVCGFQLGKTALQPSVADELAVEWNENYELQYWIMVNQSACIRRMCSLNGWSLFYRCFGTRTAALMHFSKYLHDNIPKPANIDNLPCHEICAAYDVYTFVKKLEKEKEDYFPDLKYLIIDIVRSLIEEADKEYDDVRVYIYRDNYFCQIRFVYHTSNGWRDDSQIIGQASNYDKLIELHAAVECVENKDILHLNEHNDRLYFYLNYGDNSYQYSISNFSRDVSDELSLQYKYQKWREHFAHTF